MNVIFEWNERENTYLKKLPNISSSCRSSIYFFRFTLRNLNLKKFAVRYLRMKRAKEVSFITWLLQQILFVFVEQVTQMEKTPNISKKWGLLWKNFIVTSRQIIHKWRRDIVLSLRGSRLVRQTSTSVLQRRVGRGLKLSYQVSLLAITMERRSLPLRISTRILMPFCTKKREDQAFN